ncbi:MAG: glycosyltransferase family 2 protein, partial [Myxococcota bacterium]
ALGLTLFNTLVWPRGRRDGEPLKRVSVLIPARNEEDTIEACIRAIARGTHLPMEIIVCDDRSTDRTPELLDALQREVPILTVIQGQPLLEGQVGKPRACAQLAQAARGDVLLFVDADTELTSDGLARISSLFADYRADLVTAVPRQVTGSWMERLVLPLLHVTYTSWLPLPLIWWSSDTRFLAANGQILGVRAETYRQVGGFEAVIHEIVDDMAFCRRVKDSGARVVFADGYAIAKCRMYRSAQQVWEGFSKNIYEGLGNRWWALAMVVALYGLTFIAPWVLAPVALALGASWWLPATLAWVANILMRVTLALRHDHAWLGVALHPLAVALLLAIALNSMRWSWRGQVRWRDRVYASRAQRVSGGQPAPHATAERDTLATQPGWVGGDGR